MPLGRGVVVVLCPDHRDPGFIGERAGRPFVSSMGATLASLGLRGRRYTDALVGFIEECKRRDVPTPRVRPGSYAWPGARLAAERRWAHGGSYHEGEVAPVLWTRGG